MLISKIDWPSTADIDMPLAGPYLKNRNPTVIWAAHKEPRDRVYFLRSWTKLEGLQDYGRWTAETWVKGTVMTDQL